MAASGYLSNGIVKKFSDGVLTIQDGTGTPVTTTVLLEDGGVSFTEKNSFTWHKERGTLDHRRSSEQEPIEVSFTAKYTGFYSSVSGSFSPYEALTGRGQGATGLTSTQASESDVWSANLILTITEPGGAATETITFYHFAANSISVDEGEEATTLAFTGDAVGHATVFVPYPAIGGAAS
jgi:flagellar hook-associated protein FlgK